MTAFVFKAGGRVLFFTNVNPSSLRAGSSRPDERMAATVEEMVAAYVCFKRLSLDTGRLPAACSGMESVVDLFVYRCHELSLPLNRVCTGQSSDSERARDQWQCAAVTPQVNLSFSFVSCISKHLIECIAIEGS